MPKIPEPLQKKDFRFVKIQENTKRPFEDNWQNEANYRYNDPEITKHLKKGGNYGIIGGYGDLVIIDCDQNKVEHAIEAQLPDTLKVRSGGGGAHYYYICPDLDKPIRLKDNEAGDLGDVQSTGKQAVGPTCNHPNGGTYSIQEKNDIAEVKAEEIRFALKDFLIDNKDKKEKEKKAYKNHSDTEDRLDLLDVLDVANLNKRGNEFFGSHPIHGSQTGQNFWANTVKNTWHCFRHDTGGGPLTWLAVKEGIINCSEAGRLSKGDFKKTIKAAREDYGLKTSKDRFDNEDNNCWSQIIEMYEDSNTRIAEVTSSIVDFLMEEYNFKTPKSSNRLWRFGNPIYEKDGEEFVKEKLYDHLGGNVKKQHVNEVLEEIKARTFCNRRKEKPPLNYIPVENGWYDLEKDELVDPKPQYFAINHIPVKYNPEAKCPGIKKLMNDVLRDSDVKLMQELLGFTIYRDYKFEKAFMFKGSGANGKSTVLEVIEAFLGENNIANPSLQKLGSSEYASAQLFGKLASIHADLSDKAVKNTGEFKMLTGDDLIHARRIYEEPFKFRNYATLIFSANKLPQTYDTTDAFFRRWVVLDFPYKFTSDPDDGNKMVDTDLPESILTEEELSGLFNWALEGLKRILDNNGFSDTHSRKAVKYQWLAETQPLQIYFEEGLIEKQEASVAKNDLFSHYEEFCIAMGYQSKSKKQFFKQLYGAFPSIHEKKVRLESGRERRIQGLELDDVDQVVQLVQSFTRPSRVRAREDSNTISKEEQEDQLDQLDQDVPEETEGYEKPQNLVLDICETDEPVDFRDIWMELDEHFDKTEEETKKLLNKMSNDGVVHEPRAGCWSKL